MCSKNAAGEECARRISCQSAGPPIGQPWSRGCSLLGGGPSLRVSEGDGPDAKGSLLASVGCLNSQTPRLRRSGSGILSRGVCGSSELTPQGKLRPSTVAISRSDPEASVSVCPRRRLTSPRRRDEAQLVQACLRDPVLSRASVGRYGPLHILLSCCCRCPLQKVQNGLQTLPACSWQL